uniref:Uncharacterized protein n=1 Tax=Opuntia streptacantha TaxID=393608 RepID=A0A7C9EUR5_OPUST
MSLVCCCDRFMGLCSRLSGYHIQKLLQRSVGVTCDLYLLLSSWIFADLFTRAIVNCRSLRAFSGFWNSSGLRCISLICNFSDIWTASIVLLLTQLLCTSYSDGKSCGVNIIQDES